MMFFGTGKEKYEFETAPIKRLIPIEELGIDPTSYGGNLSQYAAELKDDIILILDKFNKVLDIGAIKLDNIDMVVLKNTAKYKGLEFDWRKVTKEEIISLLGGE